MTQSWGQHTRNPPSRKGGRIDSSAPVHNRRPMAPHKPNRSGAIQKKGPSTQNKHESRPSSANGDDCERDTIMSILKIYDERLSILEDTLRARHQVFEQNSQEAYRKFERGLSDQDRRIKKMHSDLNQSTEESMASQKIYNDQQNNLGSMIESMSTTLSRILQREQPRSEIGRIGNDFDEFFQKNEIDRCPSGGFFNQ